MAIFQQTVLRKYTANLDTESLNRAWAIFQAHFHNPAKQAIIREAKEEQYQEGFLRDLFVDVLGYTLHPQPGYNLTTEYKNEKDSKKADGAILLPPGGNGAEQTLGTKFGEGASVHAVIELKGTDTTDLSKVETQAFGYLHNHKGCSYVITSNFEKLRFYIQDATDFLEFNLFTLTKPAFSLLFLCLQKDHLLANLPLQVKQQSVVQEDAVTKKLYADYSAFKQALYQNLLALNGGTDQVLLFKKTQKLLDRFLFILFAEDRLLLPPNLIVKIVEEHRQVQKLRLKESLYDRFKIYFTDLLQGNRDEDIFAYNGGLFEPDAVLDNLLIGDAVLQDGVLRLSRYDFSTEVDVNILGHIFEHSLNELEALQANVRDEAVDRSKTRRKKEGVFYTPRYITKYIVENTVGALCKEKKEAMQIVEEDFAPDKRKRDKKALLQKLDDYRAWLLALTICDPACGSGAFLNAALEFLIAEHSYVDELTNKLVGASIGFQWTPNDILEHNLFGVDINEEAVEIARLSLWLRTAQKGRKLSNLSGNIKVGNSLIDDKTVAGEKAFAWKEEFKEVFEKGGFDVVIGNPPYVRQELLGKNIKDFLIRKYRNVGNGTADIYVYFFERAMSILRNEALLGFITPNKFIKAGYGKNLRNYLSNFQLHEIIDFGELPVFQDAATFPTIFIIRNSSPFVNTSILKVKSLDFTDLNLLVEESAFLVENKIFNNPEWQFAESSESSFITRIQSFQRLDEYIKGEIKYGLKTGFNDAFVIDEETKEALIRKQPESADLIKKFVVGDDIRHYKIKFNQKYIILTKIGVEIEKYSAVKEHLLKYQKQLETRYDKGNFWWELRACNYYDDFEQPKIIYPVIAKEPRFTLDTEGFFSNDKAFIIPGDKKFLLALLNSKLIWYYLK